MRRIPPRKSIDPHRKSFRKRIANVNKIIVCGDGSPLYFSRNVTISMPEILGEYDDDLAVCVIFASAADTVGNINIRNTANRLPKIRVFFIL
jgi:hypothetical protein